MSASVAEQFSSIAAEYEAHWADVLMPANRELVAMAPMADAQAVLDLGGGVGSLACVLREVAPRSHVVVCDRAEGMVRRVLFGSPVVADALQLPFRSRSFDVVLLTFVLQFIYEPDRMFCEIARALRPGGVVAVAAWGKVTKSPAEQLWLAALDELGAPQAAAPAAPPGQPTKTPEELENQLSRTGYVSVRTTQLSLADRPDVNQFVQRMTHLGPSSRRLAAWDKTSRTNFIELMRTRLATLEADDFLDDSQVVAAVGHRPYQCLG